VSNPSAALRWYTAVTACIAWFGFLLQGYLSLQLATSNGQTVAEGLNTFFSYFTVLTNLLVCLALTWPGLARESAPGRFFASPFAVAGIAANIAFVAISYHFLLRLVWNPQGAQLLADRLLHYVVPVLFVGYWFVYFRTGALRWIHAVWWSVYPTVYFAYALIRGAHVGSYPYAFIDARALGYGRTMQNAIGLLFGFIVLGLVVVALDRRARGWTRLGSGA
jgi:hypothetical protein